MCLQPDLRPLGTDMNQYHRNLSQACRYWPGTFVTGLEWELPCSFLGEMAISGSLTQKRE